jgi:hypothetical protein
MTNSVIDNIKELFEDFEADIDSEIWSNIQSEISE